MSLLAQASVRSIAATRKATAKKGSVLSTACSTMRCFRGSFGGMLFLTTVDSNDPKVVNERRTLPNVGDLLSLEDLNTCDDERKKASVATIVANGNEAQEEDDPELMKLHIVVPPSSTDNHNSTANFEKNGSPHSSSNSSGQNTVSLSLSDAVSMQGSSIGNNSHTTSPSAMTASTSRRNFVRLLNRRRGRRPSDVASVSGVPQTVEIRSRNNALQHFIQRRKGTTSSGRRKARSAFPLPSSKSSGATATTAGPSPTSWSSSASVASFASASSIRSYKNRGPEAYA